MNPFRSILCPTDFSETADGAFQYAQRLAKASAAEIVLLHAFELPETYDHAGQTRPADPSLRNNLLALRPVDPEVNVSHALHAGDPGEVICWFAEDRGCDLIVIGTHGHTGLKHLLFGSVTEYVVRHARCPVLVVRHKLADEPRLKEPLVSPPPPPQLM